MKAYGGMDVWFRSFLSFVLGGGERSTVRPGRITRQLKRPKQEAPGAQELKRPHEELELGPW
jgi:hypothetical protein